MGDQYPGMTADVAGFIACDYALPASRDPAASVHDTDL